MRTTVLKQDTANALDEFVARLRTATTRVLMLDYDGTLAPFHVDPARAVPYPELVPLVEALLADARNRVVLVSGRWTRSLLPLLPWRIRRPEIWGCHGWERLLPDNRYSLASIQEASVRALVALDEAADEVILLGGRCEQKPASVAFHWRGLSAVRANRIQSRLRERWGLLSDHDAIEMHDFAGGIEFRAPGRDKGHVVDTLIAESGKDAAIAYLGDDATDEDAFRALAGRGLPILVQARDRPTAALHRLAPPTDIVNFLRAWLEQA